MGAAVDQASMKKQAIRAVLFLSRGTIVRRSGRRWYVCVHAISLVLSSFTMFWSILHVCDKVCVNQFLSIFGSLVSRTQQEPPACASSSSSVGV